MTKQMPDFGATPDFYAKEKELQELRYALQEHLEDEIDYYTAVANLADKHIRSILTAFAQQVKMDNTEIQRHIQVPKVSCGELVYPDYCCYWRLKIAKVPEDKLLVFLKLHEGTSQGKFVFHLGYSVATNEPGKMTNHATELDSHNLQALADAVMDLAKAFIYFS